jgi:hypothetical protein
MTAGFVSVVVAPEELTVNFHTLESDDTPAHVAIIAKDGASVGAGRRRR